MRNVNVTEGGCVSRLSRTCPTWGINQYSLRLTCSTILNEQVALREKLRRQSRDSRELRIATPAGVKSPKLGRVCRPDGANSGLGSRETLFILGDE